MSTLKRRRQSVVVLEDDPRRLKEICSSLFNLSPLVAIHAFGSSWELEKMLPELKEGCAGILLDLDLSRTPGPCNPGTGLDVVKHLCTIKPFTEVLIHSSDVEAALMMVELLESKGWKAYAIPFYREQAWRGKVQEMLGATIIVENRKRKNATPKNGGS